MRKLIGVLLLLAFVIGIGVTTMAQTPWADRREQRQRLRVQQGIRDDDLTRREALRLRAGQRRIRVFERCARADGRITRRERYRLDRMLDRSNRQIYRQRHDRQERRL